MSDDQGCTRELNRQLQSIQARVKELEDQVDSMEEVQLTDLAQTAAAFMSIITTAPEGIVTYLANQLILKIAAAALGMAQSELNEMAQDGGGDVGDLAADVANQAETVKSLIMELMSQRLLGAEFWSQFHLDSFVPLLTIPPFAMATMDAVLSAAQSSLDAAQAAMQADPFNTQLQAEYQAALQFRESINSSATAANNMARCFTSSALFKALPGGV